MPTSMRCALLAASLAIAPTVHADDLTLARSGVGITGHPVALNAVLDTNQNDRPEMLVIGSPQGGHISIVEEDSNPRGYRELARIDAPSQRLFRQAVVVDLPGVEPALLLCWTNNRCELRRYTDFGIKGTVSNAVGGLLGDVDGDGQAEVATGGASTTLFLDPGNLTQRGSVTLPLADAMIDIVGDARVELVMSSPLRAYSITRTGSTWVADEVWNPGLAGSWTVQPVAFDGRTALLLHDGLTARLATFGPTPGIRTIDTSDEYVTSIVADANGDGKADLITAGMKDLRAIDLHTGAIHWQRDTMFQAPRLGTVHFPMAIDLDGNGVSELAWADHAYESGVIAMSVPPSGAPRWRSNHGQSMIIDWTASSTPEGAPSIAYLSGGASQVPPTLSAVGFLDGVTFVDRGGSAFAWLPDPTIGLTRIVKQAAVARLPLANQPDTVAVVGSEFDSNDTPIAHLIWTFNGSGMLLSQRSIVSTATPARVVAAQVLARPERQLVVAGSMPPSGSVQNVRVEVFDYATGNVLWQSALMPTYAGASITRLKVADVDGDGQLEVIASYGSTVSVLKPSAGTGVVATYPAHQFALLDRGAGTAQLLATVDDDDVTFYEGLSAVPAKQFVLPEAAFSVAVFTQAPDDAVMFATGNYSGLAVRRYSDGNIVASNSRYAGPLLDAVDLDADGHVELIVSGAEFLIWRLRSEHIFRNGFDSASTNAMPGAAQPH